MIIRNQNPKGGTELQFNYLEEYDVDNQRQIMESLNTMKQQLNFSFQQDLKNEQDAFNYFLS